MNFLFSPQIDPLFPQGGKCLRPTTVVVHHKPSPHDVMIGVESPASLRPPERRYQGSGLR